MNNWFARISPIFTLVILIMLFAVGFIVFWYLLIFGAIVGITLFAIAYIRSRWFLNRVQKNQTPPPSPPQGRIIEHQD